MNLKEDSLNNFEFFNETEDTTLKLFLRSGSILLLVYHKN